METGVQQHTAEGIIMRKSLRSSWGTGAGSLHPKAAFPIKRKAAGRSHEQSSRILARATAAVQQLKANF